MPLDPTLLPRVLAREPETGWLLLADAGERARERPVDWANLLERYARLQIAAAPHAGALLAAGAVDNRLARLPERFEALLPLLSREAAAMLRTAMPRALEELGSLAASPLPVTLDHNDLHDANVFDRDGDVRILDWGDSAVAHPLFSLSVGLQGVEALLEPWTSYAPRAELERERRVVEAHRELLRVMGYVRVLPWEHRVTARIEDELRPYLDRFG